MSTKYFFLFIMLLGTMPATFGMEETGGMEREAGQRAPTPSLFGSLKARLYAACQTIGQTSTSFCTRTKALALASLKWAWRNKEFAALCAVGSLCRDRVFHRNTSIEAMKNINPFELSKFQIASYGILGLATTKGHITQEDLRQRAQQAATSEPGGCGALSDDQIERVYYPFCKTVGQLYATNILTNLALRTVARHVNIPQLPHCPSIVNRFALHLGSWYLWGAIDSNLVAPCYQYAERSIHDALRLNVAHVNASSRQ
jgi:hypothetical protein